MSTSLKNEVGQQRPNAPHILRDGSSVSVAPWQPQEGRILIRIPDLSDSTQDPGASRKVQRLIDVLKVLKNRPRTLAASGIVLAGAVLVTVGLVFRQPADVPQMTTAPDFDPIVHAQRRVTPETRQSDVLTTPEVLVEVPSPAVARPPALLGPSLAAQPAGDDQLAMPGVARLLGEIVPDTIEEAKHESSGPGLH
jgi:hypothetical protein